ncbi:hypothetical protein E7Z57_21230 (plasmid) [Ralstonia pseudosolanacearum]|uniref:Uncharacterized protein n=1 Tax=Ralstonia solanacearum TaxID=305 RepID=A0AA92IG79_RALSL|nr:hypothetical protein E7Z57_21230 [Ralstonia pseudosolanacearum]
MVGDCDSTIATLRKTNTVADDLPFLAEPSGDMHIHDPRAVAIGNPEKNVGTVKTLREPASGPRSSRRTFARPPAERESRHRTPTSASGPIRHPGRNPARRNTPAHEVTQKWVRGMRAARTRLTANALPAGGQRWNRGWTGLEQASADGRPRSGV